MSNIQIYQELVTRLRQFIEEACLCSMESSLITPEYVCNMRGTTMPLEEFEVA